MDDVLTPCESTATVIAFFFFFNRYKTLGLASCHPKFRLPLQLKLTERFSADGEFPSISCLLMDAEGESERGEAVMAKRQNVHFFSHEKKSKQKM